MKIILSFLILFFLISCTDKHSSKFDFLVGTWKRENVEHYEVWKKNNSLEYIGYGYRINDGKKTISETLEIKNIDHQFILTATVPDQNEGKPIQFVLNTKMDSILSFENVNHDFPKKIQYKSLSHNQIEVKVLGDEDSGFSYIQFKQ